MPEIALVANTDWYLYNFRRSLIEQLIAEGWQVTVISPRGEVTPQLTALGARHIEWNVERKSLNPLREFAAVLALRKIFKHIQPDLIHLHTSKAVIYGSLAVRLLPHFHPAVIHSIAGLGYIATRGVLPRLLRPLVFGMYRAIHHFPDARATIFENKGDLDLFTRKKMMQPQQAHLIRSVGVDLERYPVLAMQARRPMTVMLAGRLLWSKGVGIFADAARQLAGQVDARFALVGTPDPGNPDSVQQTYLDDWQQQGWMECWGWQRDMRQAYAAADVVVVPTVYGEGVPTVILEACASGRVVIATDWEGCREVIKDGETGFLVEPYSANALAEKIRQVCGLETAALAQIGRQARQAVSSGFSTTAINEKTMQVYRQAAANAGLFIDT